MTAAMGVDTRDAIVAGAFDSFRTRGLTKTTVVDIARTSGVSRSTIYEYFDDKAAIVEACAEAASQRFYREMAKTMNRGDTLEDQLVSACVFVTGARLAIEPATYFDEDDVDILLTKNSSALLRDCGDFLTRYVAAAKVTGEVGKDVDVAAAGEWLARILFSLFTTASPSIDTGDADAVADFVRRFVVRGLACDRPVRRTDRRRTGGDRFR